MAVEIRELVIKAVIADAGGEDASPHGAASDTSRDQLVQECVDQVLKILKKTKNR